MTADPSPPWLTIATIVKDDAEGLRRTRDSILVQDLSGVEWLVVDSSADRAVVEELVGGQQHIAARLEWMEPRGVYPAMNEALRLAEGTYVHFLNSGDVYASPGAVAELRRTTGSTDPVWVYGQVSFVDASGREVVPPRFDYGAERAASFSRGRFPPHQGTVVRTSALRAAGGFDTTFQIVADYAVFLRLSQIADPVEVDTVIARFYEGGVSTVRWRDSIAEFHRARVTILRPSGLGAWRERFETVGQFARIGVSRMARWQRPKGRR